jgi:hypothetical protein
MAVLLKARLSDALGYQIAEWPANEFCQVRLHSTVPPREITPLESVQ